MIWGLLLIALLIAVYAPSLWVQRVMKRYSHPEGRYPVSGAELARELLDGYGLNAVRVEPTASGDHYDPQERAVRLSESHYQGRSLAAITIAAHEVGHAVQHASGYQPFVWRQKLVKWAGRGQQIGVGLLFLAPVLGGLLRAPALIGLLALGGIMAMGSGIVVHLVTLPTEIDASFKRALPMLQRSGYLFADVDPPHARRLLSAAACTYVAQALASLLNFWAWLRMLRP
ncbi:zinc metallopeptidase [Halorhodospira halochloris]|uniref:Probable metal-dependent peptidase n=1 Tax=Halorhodospira halochloris TaxID=1052 RepID=A0A0X8X8J4_HALHR|nr:zinc metallopeptidase [Halorhodospira halochloris]MBK1651254.1 peptidase [Halorhodospira halochloris]MCG5530460.1 zinc metallopeptidase [Halorhodospira halochloris]MCG5548586.1 zinc metallopeptidase [Halorhodospira halochloris]BAU57531.1 probable metal-dependent peptidase [Halorhodospira halochloris]